jgi:hypothetical protein
MLYYWLISIAVFELSGAAHRQTEDGATAGTYHHVVVHHDG